MSSADSAKCASFSSRAAIAQLIDLSLQSLVIAFNLLRVRLATGHISVLLNPGPASSARLLDLTTKRCSSSKFSADETGL